MEEEGWGSTGTDTIDSSTGWRTIELVAAGGGTTGDGMAGVVEVSDGAADNEVEVAPILVPEVVDTGAADNEVEVALILVPEVVDTGAADNEVEVASVSVLSPSDSVLVRSNGGAILGAGSKKLKGSIPVSLPKNVTSKVNSSQQSTPARAIVKCCSAFIRRAAALDSNSAAKQKRHRD